MYGTIYLAPMNKLAPPKRGEAMNMEQYEVITDSCVRTLLDHSLLCPCNAPRACGFGLLTISIKVRDSTIWGDLAHEVAVETMGV